MTYPGCYVGVLVVRLIRPGPSRELNDEPDGVQYGQQKRVEKFLENQSSLLYITVNQCPLNRGGGSSVSTMVLEPGLSGIREKKCLKLRT